MFNRIIEYIKPFFRFIRRAFYHFFVFCSGANLRILNLDTCEPDRSKYVSIGVTVFFTGVFAFISGSYALYRVFGVAPEGGEIPRSALFFSIGIGALWGLMIFNLDRIIVTSMRKSDNRWREVGMAAPRFLMAILISFIVAKPLEIRIFEDRLTQQISTMRLDEIKQSENDINNLESFTILRNSQAATSSQLERNIAARNQGPEDTWEYQQIETAITECQAALTQLRNTNTPSIRSRANRRSTIQTEINGLSRSRDSLRSVLNTIPADSLGNPQISPDNLQSQISTLQGRIDNRANTREVLRREIIELENEITAQQDSCAGLVDDRTELATAYIADLDSSIARDRTELSDLDSRIEVQDSIASDELARYRAGVNQGRTNNLITQIEALKILEENEPVLKWTSRLLIALFILIESAPIAVKLLSSRGPYERTLDSFEDEIAAKSNEFVQQVIAENKEKNARTTRVELELHDQYLQLFKEKQTKILQRKFEQWEQESIDKIERDFAASRRNSTSSHTNNATSSSNNISSNNDTNGSHFTISNDEDEFGDYVRPST